MLFILDTPKPATPNTPWDSTVAEWRASALSSPAVAAMKAIGEVRASGAEGKAGVGLVCRDGPSAHPKAPCSRAPSPSTTTTIRPPCSLSSTTFNTSAYIAACLFNPRRPHAPNHFILPIGATPLSSIHSEPEPHVTSPARKALGLDLDAMNRAPSLQPGTAEEERARRGSSKPQQGSPSKSVRRADASKGASAHKLSLANSSKPAEQGMSHDHQQPTTRPPLRPLDQSSQPPQSESTAVKCTITPVDWPHPNSSKVPIIDPSTATSPTITEVGTRLTLGSPVSARDRTTDIWMDDTQPSGSHAVPISRAAIAPSPPHQAPPSSAVTNANHDSTTESSLPDSDPAQVMRRRYPALSPEASAALTRAMERCAELSNSVKNRKDFTNADARRNIAVREVMAVSFSSPFEAAVRVLIHYASSFRSKARSPT